jgi:F0F1-type ATP synthase delta subunit
MNSLAPTLASALIQAAAEMSPHELQAAVDDTLALARRHGVSLRNLRCAIHAEAKRQDLTLPAVLETPSGQVGEEAAAGIAHALHQALQRPVDLRQAPAPILGGAVLSLGDDRIDWSLRGALRQAEHALSARGQESPLSVS